MRALTRRAAFAVAASSLTAFTGPTDPLRTLFVMGDSWAAGLHADPSRALGQVAAARLGWAVSVDAVSGTGYVNGLGERRSYVDRATAQGHGPHADIVVVQGGSNDRDAPPTVLASAADATLMDLRRRWPGARRVMLGPGPDPLPVTAAQVAVDDVLAGVASANAVPYVSILRLRWIAPHRARWLLDPRNHHPTVAGQAYLGKRLARELRRLYPAYWSPGHVSGRGTAA